MRLDRPATSRLVSLALALLLLVPTLALAKKKDQGILNGRVLNQAEEPLTEVAITVSGNGFEQTVTSDSKGEFSFEIQNASGTYTISFAKEGYANFSTELEISPENQLNLDFRLLDAAAGRKQDAIKVYNQGADAFAKGDKATAKTAFVRATELDPGLAEPYLGLADIYLGEEQFAKAAEAAERFLALRPEETEVRRMAYEAWLGVGNEAKVAEYRDLLAQEEGLGSQLAIQVFNEGALATQSGALDQAVEKFNKALELDPKLKEAWAALSTVYYNQAKYDEALAATEKSLELDPTNVSSLRMRYLILDVRADYEALPAALDAYAAADPKGAADALYQRADMDFRDNQTERARTALEKVIELAPEHARAYYTLGLIYASSDTSKAKELLQKFITMAPDDPEVPAAKEMMSYF